MRCERPADLSLVRARHLREPSEERMVWRGRCRVPGSRRSATPTRAVLAGAQPVSRLARAAWLL